MDGGGCVVGRGGGVRRHWIGDVYIVGGFLICIYLVICIHRVIHITEL